VLGGRRAAQAEDSLSRLLVFEEHHDSGTATPMMTPRDPRRLIMTLVDDRTGAYNKLSMWGNGLSERSWLRKRHAVAAVGLGAACVVLFLVIAGGFRQSSPATSLFQRQPLQFNEDVPLRGAVPADCSECVQRHNGPMRAPGSTAKTSFQGGAINITSFGKTETKYFAGAEIIENGRGLVLTADPFEKVFLTNRPLATSSNASDFAYLQLAGNTIKVDVDMGDPGPSCGCNVAFFLVSMPAPTGGEWNDYYCDANCVGGNCCAEFDLMEMNVNALQVTSHTCSDYEKPPFASTAWSCDHVGSPEVKFGNGKQDFGPGSDFTIDSQKKFEFRLDFPIEDGSLKGYVTISQGDSVIAGNMGSLDGLRSALSDGMVLVLDAWSSDNLLWLDGGTCSVPEVCNLASTDFSNIAVEKFSGLPADRPSPAAAAKAATEEEKASADSTEGEGALPPPPPPYSTLAPTPEPTPPPAPKECPGTGFCDCSWTKLFGCSVDDASECFCRCCCDEMEATCQWNPNMTNTSQGNSSTGNSTQNETASKVEEPPEKECPGEGSCDCSWSLAMPEIACKIDDGSECFCRCCCEEMEAATCKWSPPPVEKGNTTQDKAENMTGSNATAAEDFDCQAGLPKWQTGWSTAKKTWCCSNKKLGCEEVPEKQCPGEGSCDCAWADTLGEQACLVDDGSECFCRCCCDRMEGACKWAAAAPDAGGTTSNATQGDDEAKKEPEEDEEEQEGEEKDKKEESVKKEEKTEEEENQDEEDEEEETDNGGDEKADGGGDVASADAITDVEEETSESP